MTVWTRLGFGQAQAPIVPDRDGQPAIYVVTVALLNWRDRLRVLLSGRVMFVAACYVAEDVQVTATYPAVAVMPPAWGERVPTIQPLADA